MRDSAYMKELQDLVSTYLTKEYAEYFYWDILPQLSERTREAYYRCTGDSRFRFLEGDVI